ncbi:MAG: hypothetical protein KAV00_09845 [Phycisphaerae bacterium]|nr:hypothetical protein [Phycisphaerae bacterium]
MNRLWFLASVVVGTAVINVVSRFIVFPLAKRLYDATKRRMRIVQGLPPNPDKYWYTTATGRARCVSSEEMSGILSRLMTWHLIALDVGILGCLGILLGLLGLPLICIPLKLRGLPGAIAVIFGALVTMELTGGGLLGISM